mmetsp:Transcript_10945/g.27636  ORF Transcript_10945/g.27636 Transcript_10945/m.27636 type:complete len:200 (-) Transcript_10945:118-717(-)
MAPPSSIHGSPHLPHSTCFAQSCSPGGALSTQSWCTRMRPESSFLKNATSSPDVTLSLLSVTPLTKVFAGAAASDPSDPSEAIWAALSETMFAVLMALPWTMWNWITSCSLEEREGLARTSSRVSCLPICALHFCSMARMASSGSARTVKGPASFDRAGAWTAAGAHAGAGGQYQRKHARGGAGLAQRGLASLPSSAAA